ncbi:MAG: HAMP domain-containing sensor histidine kinase [Pseudomonadota bacterium]
MLRRLAAFSNSIVVRVVGLVLGFGAVTALLVIALLQTPVAGQILNRAIEGNSDSIAELVWLVEHTPVEIETFLLAAYNTSSRVAEITEEFGPDLKPDEYRKALVISGKSGVVERLSERDIRFETLGLMEVGTPFTEREAAPLSAATALHVAIGLRDGRALHIWLAPTISLTERPNLVIVTILLGLFLIALLSIAMSLVITQPIRQLERDAQNAGLGEKSFVVAEEGPRELRQLSSSLDRMQSRLARLIHEREQIIVAIAHDISTGLTRLRLRIDERERVDPAELEDDMAQMERLVYEMMAYSRAESPLIEPELIDLSEFVDHIARASPSPIVLSTSGPWDFTMAGNRVALKRLFENLIENARRYGRGLIELRMERREGGLEIAVLDDGEGLPEQDLEQVFEPFFRAESSRNRATGGTGLGLGIARAIAQTHGARITLENRPEGGLAARVFFPNELAT